MTHVLPKVDGLPKTKISAPKQHITPVVESRTKTKTIEKQKIQCIYRRWHRFWRGRNKALQCPHSWVKWWIKPNKEREVSWGERDVPFLGLGLREIGVWSEGLEFFFFYQAFNVRSEGLESSSSTDSTEPSTFGVKKIDNLSYFRDLSLKEREK